MQLRSKRIDDFEKWELVEIGIPGADSADSVLAHENGGVRVVHQITGEVRQLRNDFFGDIGVSLRRKENAEAGRLEQRRDKGPRRGCGPWRSHDSRVCCYAQKLIKDAPRRVPSMGPLPLSLKPVATGGMKL
jgi:hypothetical protein